MISVIANPCRVLQMEEVTRGVFWLREHIDHFDKYGCLTRVPCGFVMDGYSVPIVGRWLTKYGLSAIPCAIHDWDYLTGKKFVTANNDLVRSSILCGESSRVAHILGVGTMTFGWIPYLEYKVRRNHNPYLWKQRIARTREQAINIAKDIVT